MLPVQGVLILISSPNPLEVIEPGNRMLPLQLVESVVNCHLPVRSIRFSGCEHETVNRNKNNKELIFIYLIVYGKLVNDISNVVSCRYFLLSICAEKVLQAVLLH